MKKKLLFMVCALIMAVGLVSCGEEEKTDYTQGETVTYKGVEYTVTSVERSEGTEFDAPADGNEYIIVGLKIENKSEEKISYNGLDWQMINSKGQEDSEAFSIVNSDTALNSGELSAGGVKEGTVVFEQRAGDTGLVLTFYENILLDDEPAFKITLK